MAARKPLVINSGQIQQLQSGDTLDASVSESNVVNMTNGDAGAHSLGEVVYVSAADTARLATANSSTTAKAIGVATGSVTAGATGDYKTGGLITGLSGLTAGATYYLDATTPGATTTTAPTAAGEFVTKIGVAITTTELLIEIERPILL